MSEGITSKIATINIDASKIYVCQCCLLCENTRRLPESMHYCNTPWVCDECKEAIVFVKELKHEREEFDPLKPILD